MLDDINHKVELLTKCLSNLKKSRYNTIKTSTLLEKSQLAENIKREIEEYLTSNKETLSETKLVLISKLTRQTNLEIQELIKLKISENDINQKNKMPEAALAFDYKRATALVQPYDGSSSGLNTFLDSVSLLEELTPEANLEITIKFIKTRLSGRARTALPQNPTTIAAITNAIKTVCQSTDTPESILAKLKALRNKGDQQKFLETVENLSNQLAMLYTNIQVPAQVANQMATKAGVETLINGTSSTEIRTVLMANEFSSIQKAIQKFNESQSLQPTQVLNYTVQNNRGRGRGNYNNFRGSYNHNQNNNRTNYRNQNDYRNQNRYQNRGRGNNYHRGNGRGNHHQNHGQNYNRGGQGQHVYYAQAENCPVPQQLVVGGNNPPNQQQAQQQNQQMHQCAMINRN